QLEHAERLRDVIVGASVEQVHLFVLRMTSRKHDDRHSRRAPDVPAHVDPGHVWKAEVENHEVWSAADRRVDPGVAIGCFGDLAAHLGERVANRPADLGLVVDHQDQFGVTHGSGAWRNRARWTALSENLSDHRCTRLGAIGFLTVPRFIVARYPPLMPRFTQRHGICPLDLVWDYTH